jgi:quinol monooxygenase YgiN
MFTRIVELTTKPGKNKQLADTIDEKVLPILKKQKGFVDETVFVSEKEDNRVLALGFWNTKEDAEQYHRAEYQKVHETIRHLLESEPVIRTFNVHSSTNLKIAAGKAAGSAR